ncbi:transcription elongation regulator 1-like protein [Ictidomys tridecemlineatus]|nr:transcription elongation regulator 1-like protein [Ictidomys tridecemlineatus]
MPNCKIFVNNSFALDSTWIHPGDSGLLHLLEKPPVLDQVALTLSRPIAASRPRPAVVLGPQPMPGGCHNSLKPISNSPTIAIAAAAAAAAAAMVSVDPEGLRGPSPASVQPCHFLTLAPIKIPLLTAPFSGSEPQQELIRRPAFGFRVSSGHPSLGPGGPPGMQLSWEELPSVFGRIRLVQGDAPLGSRHSSEALSVIHAVFQPAGPWPSPEGSFATAPPAFPPSPRGAPLAVSVAN